MELLNSLLQVDTVVQAAIIAGVGSVIVKLVEKWMNSRNDSFNEGERIRGELREEIEALKLSHQALREEADSWRAKYWEAMSIAKTNEHRLLELQREVDHLRAIVLDNIVDNSKSED